MEWFDFAPGLGDYMRGARSTCCVKARVTLLQTAAPPREPQPAVLSLCSMHLPTAAQSRGSAPDRKEPTWWCRGAVGIKSYSRQPVHRASCPSDFDLSPTLHPDPGPNPDRPATAMPPAPCRCGPDHQPRRRGQRVRGHGAAQAGHRRAQRHPHAQPPGALFNAAAHRKARRVATPLRTVQGCTSSRN